jgi:membrane protease YdiL (CAAX protease family)
MKAATSEPAASESISKHATKLTHWKSISVFYGIACGVSWILWLPLILGRDGLQLLKIAPALPIIVSLGTVGPFIACYTTHRIETGDWHAVRLLPGPKLQLAWLVLGPMLVIVCFFLVFPALVSTGNPATWHWHLNALAGLLVPMFNYNLLGGPLFEEFGWRGFLQSRLQRVLPAWLSAVCVGAMWAIWHFPLFLVTGWTSASTPVFLLLLIGVSLVMAFGFNASGQSVVVAVLMHSAFNSSPRCLGEFLRSVNMRGHPSGELLLAASFLLAGAVLAVLTRGKLAAFAFRNEVVS